MSVLTPDLACQQAVELVTDYLEGKLSWRQRRRFEKHLRGCPELLCVPAADPHHHRARRTHRAGSVGRDDPQRPHRPVSPLPPRRHWLGIAGSPPGCVPPAARTTIGLRRVRARRPVRLASVPAAIAHE